MADTSPGGGYSVAIDLGTSNTVAVLRWPDGRTRPLLFDGNPILPSGVFLDPEGRLHVGRDAQRMAGLDPARFEPNPKRRIDEDAVVLADRAVPVVDLLAAILGAVARAVMEAVGFLPATVLTYPAAWGQPRRDKLVAAAARAGWPPVHLVPEPVAAARYFADVLRRPVPFGSSLAVFDFGGGTLDIAVVRNDNGRFVVTGTGGIPDLGGLDVDAALVEHLGAVINERDPASWQALTRPDTTTMRRDRRLFWEDVRGAKEMLSRTTVAPITVPGVEHAVHLTREELERVASPLLRRAVYETSSVIVRSGLRPDQLAGLFLVGGSSRLPLVARLLHAELGVAPTVLEQPELPVAEGALAELPAFVAAAPVPASGRAPAPAPPPVAPPPPVPARRPWYARPATWVAAVAGLLVLAIGGVTGYVVLRSSDRAVSFQSVHQTATFPTGLQPGDVDAISVQVSGDTAYAGWQHGDSFDVAAIPLAGGNPRWRRTIDGTSKKWADIRVVPGAVVVTADNIDSKQPRRMSVLDPATGTERWHKDIYGGDDVLQVGKLLIVVSVHDGALYGYAIQNGKQAWVRPDPKDSSGDPVGTQTMRVTTPDNLTGPADLNGQPVPADTGDDTRLAQITDGRVLNVIDTSDGKVKQHHSSLGTSFDDYLAYDGKVYEVTRSNGYHIQAYDLDKLGEPVGVYSAPDSTYTFEAIAPCGAGRICVLDRAKDPEVVAIDVAARKAVWHKPAPGAGALIPVGDRVLATSLNGSPASWLFDRNGKQLLATGEQGDIGVRVNSGSLIFFSNGPTTYASNVSLSGVAAASGKYTALGELKDVRSGACSWNEQYIACARQTDFAVWRFAA
jgi:actin-like ATPase involved in cell morphogenesis